MVENYKVDIHKKISELNTKNVDTSTKAYLGNILDSANIDAHVSVRIKDLNSAVEKMTRKGYTSVDQVTDLIGGKVVVNSIEDVYKVKDIINSKYKTYEINDYIKIPRSGYMSLHMDIDLNGQRVEIQVKTKGMDKAQQITHDTLYKGDYIRSEEINILKEKLCKEIFRYYTENEFNHIKEIPYDYDNPILKLCEKEKARVIEDRNSVNAEKKYIEIERDRLNKANIYINHINEYTEKLKEYSGLKKLLHYDKYSSYKKSIEMFRNKLEECKVKDLKDYEQQSRHFESMYSKYSERMLKHDATNKSKLMIINRVKDIIVDIEHKEVKELYKDYGSSLWDKTVTVNISTLNHAYNKILTIKEIEELSSNNKLALKATKAIKEIFSKQMDKGHDR